MIIAYLSVFVFILYKELSRMLAHYTQDSKKIYPSNYINLVGFKLPSSKNKMNISVSNLKIFDLRKYLKDWRSAPS